MSATTTQKPKAKGMPTPKAVFAVSERGETEWDEVICGSIVMEMFGSCTSVVLGVGGEDMYDGFCIVECCLEKCANLKLR